MKAALKGIQADLRELRDDESRVRSDADAKIKRAEAERDEKLAALAKKREPLEAAKAALMQGPTPEERKESVARRARKRAKRKTPTPPPPDATQQTDTQSSNGEGPLAVAHEMERHLRDHGNGGMTEKQLTVAVGLDRRGGHNTARAAIRKLVLAGTFIEVNSTSDDGTPLYTLAHEEAAAAHEGAAVT